MIFDKFCGLVERHMTKYRPLLNEVKIFHFPAIPHEVLPKGLDIKFFGENFFLPFQTIAIEDTASVVILHDKSVDTRGLYEERVFIECLPMDSDWRNYGDSQGLSNDVKDYYMRIGNKYKDSYIITVGRIQLIPKETTTKGYTAEGIVIESGLCSKDKYVSFNLLKPTEIDTSILVQSALRNACTAIEEVIYFNSPDRFVLESKPIKVKREKVPSDKLKKIPRSNDRPIYTLLKPKEIRERLGIRSSNITDGGTKEGHPRRRHFRTLRSDFFKEKRGEQIIIPATWVGVSEVQRGNKLYRVMLEL